MKLEEMKEIKKEKGLTNEQIAEWSDLPVSTVAKIFSGETKHPRFETMQALEKMFSNPKLPSYSGPTYDYDQSNPPGQLKDAEPERYYRVFDDGSYTADDLDRLRGDKAMGELLDGVFLTIASPSAAHQLVQMKLSAKLDSYVESKGGDCLVFTAPLDVYLEKNDRTVLQPDILVICNRNLIQNGDIWGAPDLVIEIISPSTRDRDMTYKYAKYRLFGVREYWVVDPKNERIIVHDFSDEDMIHIHDFQDKIPVGIWDGDCIIDFAPIARELAAIQSDSSC